MQGFDTRPYTGLGGQCVTEPLGYTIMKTIDLKQKKAAMNECLTVRNGQPFLKLFASETEPLKLLCAYALFCRGKDTTAFSLLEKAGVDKHVLLDISSLHQILRQLHFWGAWIS